MSLTTAQLATLATDIGNQASLATARTAKDATLIPAFYNALSSPAVAMWRSNVGNSEIASSIVASAYIALTALQQKALDLYMGPDACDASSANVRAGFSSIFGAGSATLTNLTAVSQRTATRLEVLLGAGGPPIVSAAFNYTLTAADVRQAMGW